MVFHHAQQAGNAKYSKALSLMGIKKSNSQLVLSVPKLAYQSQLIFFTTLED